jgi:hypothetical protein
MLGGTAKDATLSTGVHLWFQAACLLDLWCGRTHGGFVAFGAERGKDSVVTVAFGVGWLIA